MINQMWELRKGVIKEGGIPYKEKKLGMEQVLSGRL